MNLETLNCNNCGAPLEVPDSANFVRCNHCEAKLAIRRTESSTTTEQLEEIQDKQDRLLEKISSLERQNRLAQIDRQWDREKQSLMIVDKHGNRQEPNEITAVLIGVIAVVVGLFWTIGTASSSGPFALFGVAFMLFGVGMGMYQYYKAGEFRAAKRRYRRTRLAAIKSADKNATSPREFLAQLDNIPTPHEYLEQLGEDES